MSILTAAKSLYLRYLSKPAADRSVYRAIRRGQVRKIVELGVGAGVRTLRMLDVAGTDAGGDEIHYTGLDLFEARSPADGPGMTLKTAHKTLRGVGVRVQLVPGEPAGSLTRVANSLGKIDLLLISTGIDMSSFRAWWFVPRMLHERTLVYVEMSSEGEGTTWRLMPRAEIDELAAAASVRRAA